MSITLPMFKDGETLDERQLYGLAAFALDWARWSVVGWTSSAFFPPPPDLTMKVHSWNGVDVEGEKVLVRPLFLLHQGYPFITTEPVQLRPEGDRLYARLRIAKGSMERLDGDPGYQVDFAWEPKNEEGRFVAVVELARRRTGFSAFELAPPASVPSAVPELADAVAKLASAAETFQAQLVRHAMRTPSDRKRAARPPVDCDVVMDRLRRLVAIVGSAPMRALTAELLLAVSAIRGFFFRLRYDERPDRWSNAGERLGLLSGVVLEVALQDAADFAQAGLPATLRDPGPIDGASAQIKVIASLARSMSEGGDFWQLLADTTIPQCGEFQSVRAHVGYVFDCAGVSRVAIELSAEPRGNVTYGFTNEKNMPTTLSRLDMTTTTDGRREAELDVAGRFFFLSAPENVSAKVQPE